MFPDTVFFLRYPRAIVPSQRNRSSLPNSGARYNKNPISTTSPLEKRKKKTRTSLVSRKVARDVVYVDEDAGLIARVHTGDRHEGRRGAVAAVDDVDLRASDVELRALEGRGDVQADLLYAREVLAAWEALGEGELEGLLRCANMIFG